MTFDEACELARVISGTSRFAVMAIGRFVVQSELAEAYAGGFVQKLPWGVSVVALDSSEFPKVIRSEQAWQEFVNGAPKPEPLKVAPTQAASATRARAAQGMLDLY